MKFDFDEIVGRRGSGSYKWDTPASGDVLPMWVADMDFQTAPVIIEALKRRVEHGVFGYTKVGADYYQAVSGWFNRRHGFRINPSTIIYTSGVVPAISAIIKAICNEGDGVITQTPAYNCFFSSIRNNGCRLVENPLRYIDGRYTIDFDDLDKKAAMQGVKMLILCNPHNPSGRVWTRDELLKVADIARRNDLFVISDEIHCELTYGDFHYTPWATMPEDVVKNSAICLSPSKAFNIAGLQIANIVATDPSVYARIDKAININEVCDVNPFGVEATIAAYNHGEPWLVELLEYLWGNYMLLCDEFSRHLPHVKITPLQGTYLAWVNISATRMTADEVAEGLLEQKRLMINSGTMYGDHTDEFIRINLACPRSLLVDAIARMVSFLKQ